jgi:hypothetical protein
MIRDLLDLLKEAVYVAQAEGDLFERLYRRREEEQGYLMAQESVYAQVERMRAFDQVEISQQNV